MKILFWLISICPAACADERYKKKVLMKSIEMLMNVFTNELMMSNICFDFEMWKETLTKEREGKATGKSNLKVWWPKQLS